MSEKRELANIETTVPFCILPRAGWWIGAMLLLALSACASIPEQSAAPIDKQQIVARIAQSRWDALMKKNFEAAYKMLSPASRTVITLEDFQRKSSMVTWKAASVRKVECSADDLCAVQMDVTYEYTLRRVGKEVENSQVVAETWRNTAGGWWYVPPDTL